MGYMHCDICDNRAYYDAGSNFDDSHVFVVCKCCKANDESIVIKIASDGDAKKITYKTKDQTRVEGLE